MSRKAYPIINLILAVIILLVFAYSILFSVERSNYPLPSLYEKITGMQAPSSGMSRAFSELVRGNMDSARSYNEDSLLIFAFFLIQFVQRMTVTALWYLKARPYRVLLTVDIALTTALFIYCFKGQILKMIALI